MRRLVAIVCVVRRHLGNVTRTRTFAPSAGHYLALCESKPIFDKARERSPELSMWDTVHSDLALAVVHIPPNRKIRTTWQPPVMHAVCCVATHKKNKNSSSSMHQHFMAVFFPKTTLQMRCTKMGKDTAVHRWYAHACRHSNASSS